MRFSQRLGLAPISKEIQLKTLDNDLRAGLWNAYLQYVINNLPRGFSFAGRENALDEYFRVLWKGFFKLPMDQISEYQDQNIAEIRKIFFTGEYDKVYDFIEFQVSDMLLKEINYPFYLFINECNRVLEEEFAGYRFIDRILTPISNQAEAREISEALNIGSSFFGSKYANVNLHMGNALAKLSDKRNPDYRNSIKESISAVESICRQLTGESTLGEALKALESKGFVINTQLKAGIEKLYHYTNQKDTGIRHALIEGNKEISFHEAKFMLVVCSAFINFLVSQIS